MSDSEIEDCFLLEALENVEKSKASPIQATSSDSEIFGSDDCTRNQENISPNHDKPLENNRTTLIAKLSSITNSRKAVPNLSDKPNVLDAVSDPSYTASTNKCLEKENFENFSKLDTPRLPIVSSGVSSVQENERYRSNCKSNLNNVTLFSRDTLGRCSPISSVIRKRKFPGPAGLLPKWESRELIKSNELEIDNSKCENDTAEATICSQTSAQDFYSGSWKQMQTDFDLLLRKNSAKFLFPNHSIRSILRKAALRGQASVWKISFIVVMVKSIDISNTGDVSTVFQDETGEIHGTICKDVMEKHYDSICNGTVFVLRDITVLSPASLQQGMSIKAQLRKHYLNITLNCIITIYWPNEDDTETNKIEIVTVTENLIASLLTSDEGFRERNELIENEECKGQNKEIQLFDNFSSEQIGPGASAKAVPNLPNVNYNKSLSSTINPSSSKQSFHSLPFKSPAPNKPCQNLQTLSANRSSSTLNQRNPIKSHFKTSMDDNSAKNLKLAKEAFLNLSDDEMDDILADINTDNM